MSDEKKFAKNQSGKDRNISEEEASLWAKVAQSATPLKKQIRKKDDNEKQESLDEPLKPQQRTQQEHPASSRPKPPPLADFDRRNAKQLASGRLDIDARLDLHGLQQGPAHSALRSFLINAQAQGYRHVLVITGKGKKDDYNASTHWSEANERGVLKQMLPMWLSEPEFRALIVSYSEAHGRHGGEGAYYVRIRRSKN